MPFHTLARHQLPCNAEQPGHILPRCSKRCKGQWPYILLGCSTPLYSFIAPLRRSLMRDMLGAQLYPKPGTNVRCFGMLCWTVRHNCAMLFFGPCYAVLLAKRHAMLGAIVRCYSPGGAMLGASGAQVRGQCTARSGEACQGPLYLNPPSADLPSCNSFYL